MPTHDHGVPAAAAENSPGLPTGAVGSQNIDDVVYPSAETVAADEIDDWIVLVEDALIEARNGVTAIAWPFALAGLFGLLTLLATIADTSPDLWLGLTGRPWTSIVCAVLLVTTVLAFKLADETSAKRRSLAAIRRSYLRRRRQLAAANAVEA